MNSFALLLLLQLLSVAVNQPVKKSIDIASKGRNRNPRALKHEIPCRINQYFDEEEGRCLGIAGGGKVLYINNTKSCGVNVLKPHCGNPNYYYVCKKNKTILIQCVQGQHFDNRLQKCVHVDTNNFSSSTVQSVFEDYESMPLPECERPGSFPVPGDCTLFYVCETNGHRMFQNFFRCPDNMTYDEETEMCGFSSKCKQIKSNVTLCAPIVRNGDHYVSNLTNNGSQFEENHTSFKDSEDIPSSTTAYDEPYNGLTSTTSEFTVDDANETTERASDALHSLDTAATTAYSTEKEEEDFTGTTESFLDTTTIVDNGFNEHEPEETEESLGELSTDDGLTGVNATTSRDDLVTSNDEEISTTESLLEGTSTEQSILNDGDSEVVTEEGSEDIVTSTITSIDLSTSRDEEIQSSEMGTTDSLLDGPTTEQSRLVNEDSEVVTEESSGDVTSTITSIDLSTSRDEEIQSSEIKTTDSLLDGPTTEQSTLINKDSEVATEEGSGDLNTEGIDIVTSTIASIDLSTSGDEEIQSSEMGTTESLLEDSTTSRTIVDEEYSTISTEVIQNFTTVATIISTITPVDLSSSSNEEVQNSEVETTESLLEGSTTDQSIINEEYSTISTEVIQNFTTEATITSTITPVDLSTFGGEEVQNSEAETTESLLEGPSTSRTIVDEENSTISTEVIQNFTTETTITSTITPVDLSTSGGEEIQNSEAETTESLLEGPTTDQSIINEKYSMISTEEAIENFTTEATISSTITPIDLSTSTSKSTESLEIETTESLLENPTTDQSTVDEEHDTTVPDLITEGPADVTISTIEPIDVSTSSIEYQTMQIETTTESSLEDSNESKFTSNYGTTVTEEVIDDVTEEIEHNDEGNTEPTKVEDGFTESTLATNFEPTTSLNEELNSTEDGPISNGTQDSYSSLIDSNNNDTNSEVTNPINETSPSIETTSVPNKMEFIDSTISTLSYEDASSKPISSLEEQLSSIEDTPGLDKTSPINSTETEFGDTSSKPISANERFSSIENNPIINGKKVIAPPVINSGNGEINSESLNKRLAKAAVSNFKAEKFVNDITTEVILPASNTESSIKSLNKQLHSSDGDKQDTALKRNDIKEKESVTPPIAIQPRGTISSNIVLPFVSTLLNIADKIERCLADALSNLQS